jgi:hypothetical protein
MQSTTGLAEEKGHAPRGGIEKKIAEAPQELHRKKCNHYRQILASTVPNYIQPRPVIVPWSSLYRARLGA